MIEGVLDTLETHALDPTLGFNALVVTHNTTASFKLLRVETIDVWDTNQLPSAMNLPAILIEWDSSPLLNLVSQGKWRGEHAVRIWYWIKALDVEKNRRHSAGMASVVRAWVDTLSSQGTIKEIQPIRMDPLSWRSKSDLFFSGFNTTLQIQEQDEQAIP